jgi:hypothetical protein
MGLGDAGGRAAADPHHDQPRPARPPGRQLDVRAVEQAGSPPTTASRCSIAAGRPRLPPRGAIVLFHRGHEHGGRMAHLVDELDLPDFEFYAWDARGHGRSPGERGYSPSFASSVRDIQTFVDHISQRHGHPPEQMARGGTVGRRGRRLDLGARLRASGSERWCWPRPAFPCEALRAVRPAGSRADAEAARQISSCSRTSRPSC